MKKFLCLAVIGLAASVLTLATPADGRADDHRHRSNLSVGIGSGGFQFDYSRGHGGSYQNYGSRGSFYGPVYGGYYAPRPVIVQPTEYHWTPYQGWHTHGQILVPHRGHYHVRPY